MSGATAGRVYLDWNASAPLRPEARAAMLEAIDCAGNPSSVHAEGRAARAIIERARAGVASLLACDPAEIVFTSGATEAAQIALASCRARPDGAALWMCPGIEHDCVAAFCDAERVLDCTRDGEIDIAPARGRPGALAVQMANSETGALQDIAPIAGAGDRIVCTDPAQAAGNRALDLAALGADLAAVSAHKLGGPAGVGCLVVRGAQVAVASPGGGQEQGRRAGTENLAGIAGFGAAAAAAARDLADGAWDRVADLRDSLEARLAETAPKAIFFGRNSARLPNTACFAVPGWQGETQVMQLDLAGFAVSAGSACSSGKVDRSSRVLRAMGHDDVTASSAIRVSLGPKTTEAEVAAFAETWTDLYGRRERRAA